MESRRVQLGAQHLEHYTTNVAISLNSGKLLAPFENVCCVIFRTVSWGRCFLRSHPPEENLGPVETVIGLAAFSLAILGPAGWFLSHLQSYKKKEKTNT
ncbi:uncharacterized protein LOC102373396 [Alligator sinensis]|uniref:Uncharacterized protein LOC102373396 n=1 Tax=Alligator sinensis TaxID=38654 RepID=A0A3Q0GQI3_ALLSI|nr:uncharacterized protein LOC102373396 [Alligator sinensis]